MLISTSKALCGPLRPFAHNPARRWLLTLCLSFWGLTATLAQSGPCSSLTNKTTTNGLGNNYVYDVYAVGSTIYAATGNGLSISTNGGSTFTNITTNGLSSANLRAVYAVGSTIYVAIYHGGLGISTNGGTSFTNKTTANGLGNRDVNRVYATSSTIYAATISGLSISTDGGTSFTNKTTTDGLGSSTLYGVYAVGSTIYAATQAGLSISTNGGTSFTNKTTTDGLGNNIVYDVYAVGSTIYAATNGGLSISTNGGTSFTNKTTTNGLGSNTVYGVYAVNSTIYVATGGGLSISTNGGTSFTNKTTTNGLGSNTVNKVYAVVNTIYAATGGGVSFCTDAALPVSLVSFAAQLTANGQTQMDWQTAWEQYADRFEVQRSTDGLETFAAIGSVRAQGITDVRQVYQFTDAYPPAGVNYYRLRQVDTDGSFTFSKIVAVRVAEGQPLLRLLQNPVANGTISVQLRHWQANDLTLSNLSGQPIGFTATTGATGMVTVQPSASLPSGMYVLMARRNGTQQSVRVLVE